MNTSKEKGRIYSKRYRAKNSEKVLSYSRKRLYKFKEFILKLKKLKGGKCVLCNYEEEIRILHFHHLRDKKFELSSSMSFSEEKRAEEAEKCILLCPNCHALTHLKNLNYEVI